MKLPLPKPKRTRIQLQQFCLDSGITKTVTTLPAQDKTPKLDNSPLQENDYNTRYNYSWTKDPKKLMLDGNEAQNFFNPAKG